MCFFSISRCCCTMTASRCFQSKFQLITLYLMVLLLLLQHVFQPFSCIIVLCISPYKVFILYYLNWSFLRVSLSSMKLVYVFTVIQIQNTANKSKFEKYFDDRKSFFQRRDGKIFLTKDNLFQTGGQRTLNWDLF